MNFVFTCTIYYIAIDVYVTSESQIATTSLETYLQSSKLLKMSKLFVTRLVIGLCNDEAPLCDGVTVILCEFQCD